MNKTSFTGYGLNKEIVRALTGLKYERPTEVQEKVIPVALQKNDLVVKSQTGTGKTASFGIPL
uniref:DEAD/DEAH box helicase n=1 Tax=Streptococcus sobrinus TaxID=1310 RepID=UPI000496A8E6